MSKKSGSNFSSIFPYIAIPVALIVGVLIYMFVLGNPANFEGGDPHLGHPIDGNLYGTIYKGGFIVPFLIATNIVVLTFFLERLISLFQARGTGSVDKFVHNVRTLLNNGQIDAAIAACDKQKGSVGNVTLSAIKKYKALISETSLDKEQKLAALSKEVEEATSLELPMLEKNLTIIATLASVSTLIGLLGTVVGMIKAFASLGNSGGSTDSSALANGISEALINTALGIGTSAICIIAYNVFTAKIDELTYSIDEIGLSVNQNYATHHN